LTGSLFHSHCNYSFVSLSQHSRLRSTINDIVLIAQYQKLRIVFFIFAKVMGEFDDSKHQQKTMNLQYHSQLINTHAFYNRTKVTHGRIPRLV
jgi:hypothetical protein